MNEAKPGTPPPNPATRWAKWLKAALLLVLLILAASLYSLLDSARGLRIAAEWAPRLSAGALTVGGVEGRVLGGDFELRKLAYTSAHVQVHLDRLHLHWRPAELLGLRLHVDQLDIDDLAIGLTASDTAAGTDPLRLPTRMPLNLIVDGLDLHDFTLQQGKNESFALDNLHFAGSWIGDRVEIVQLATALPQTGPLVLNGKVQVAADRLKIATLHLSGPGTLDAQGTLGIGTASSELKLVFHDWQYPLIGDDAPPRLLGLQGEMDFTGTPDRYQARVQADGLAQKQPLALSAHGEGSGQAFNIQALELSLGSKAKSGRASAQGKVAWSPALRADIELQLSQIDPGALAAEWNGVINGNARTTTLLQNGEATTAFTLKIENSKLRGQALRLAAAGTIDPHQLQLDALTLNAGGGAVSASGQFAWSPSLSGRVDARLQRFNPGIFAPQWPGALNGRLTARTQSVAGTPEIQFDAQLADSRLRNYPLSLAAAGLARNGVVNLSRFQLASGATRLSASGRVTPPFDAAGTFTSPDLAAAYPGLEGHLDFDFKVQGTLDDPHVLSHGSGANLRYQEERIANLKWTADVQPSAPSQLEVVVTDGYAGVAIPKLQLTAQGNERYQHVELLAQTERGNLSLALQGGYDRRRMEWGGEWQSIHVAPQGLPAWSLEKPVGLLLGAQRFSLEPACFLAAGDGGRTCFNLEQKVTQPGVHLAVKLEAVALAGFEPLLPEGVKLAGKLDGEGDLRWVDHDFADTHAQLRLSETTIRAPNVPALTLETSTLTLEQQTDGGLRAALNLKSAQGQIAADVIAANATVFAQRPLSGQLHIAVPDIAFMTPYVSELAAATGHIDGELRVAGTVGAPRFAGSLTLADAQAKLVTPGIALTELNAKLVGDGNGPLQLQAQMRSGDGHLAIAGSVDPAVQPLHADLHVTGTDFLAISIPSGRVWVTPDLHLLRDESGVHVDGTLNVPKADITPKDLGDSGVSISRDQVLIVDGQPQLAVVEAPLNIYSNVQLALGDQVKFTGFGLTTRVEGAVTVNEQPLHAATALGELRLVDGAYKAYGQDLKIDDGRLIFSGGNLTQPALDISASRHPVDDITVGVHVRGTLDKPLLTLQSEPVMTREQQLSWLVLGQPLEQSSSQDRSAITSAALSLGLGGGDFLANRIGKKLGIDTISVGAAPADGSDVTANATAIAGSQAAQNAGTANANAAAFTLGKYLTPKLFVSYGVSLFQPGQVFRLLYTLGHGFKLQAESGVANGGDLLYTYERGRAHAPAVVAPK